MIKTKEEIEIMREGGRRLAIILNKLLRLTEANVNTAKLNKEAERLIREGGDEPSFLGYKPEGAKRPYPSALCVSVNDEIVHGISNEEKKILKQGDIVGLDLGLKHKGFFVDMAITVGIGKISKEDQKLLNITKEALQVGINSARVGNTIGDIGYAIEKFAKQYSYGIPVEIGGHGIGRQVHQMPHIPNYGKRGEGKKLKIGQTLALEPMLNAGSAGIVLDKDGYTYKTLDGKNSAHFEHTILITEGEAEVLTKIQTL
jgi:methionyl aminopeptidase